MCYLDDRPTSEHHRAGRAPRKRRAAPEHAREHVFLLLPAAVRLENVCLGEAFRQGVVGLRVIVGSVWQRAQARRTRNGEFMTSQRTSVTTRGRRHAGDAHSTMDHETRYDVRTAVAVTAVAQSAVCWRPAPGMQVAPWTAVGVSSLLVINSPGSFQNDLGSFWNDQGRN